MTSSSPARERSAALRQLDRRFRKPLFAYFIRRVRDRNDAEDLTQEAFLRLALHPDSRGGATIDAYVFTIAANLLRDRARAQAVRGPPQPFAETDLEGGEERTPERVVIGRERLNEVVRILKDLNDRTRDIFVLSRLENVPHREIAALYGISVSAVEKHVIRALAHLSARDF